jgi:hypothetical protein
MPDVTIVKLVDERAIAYAVTLIKLGFSLQFAILKLQMMGYYIPYRDEKTGEIVDIKF